MSISVWSGLPGATPLSGTTTLVAVEDPVPQDNDVVAGGWGAFFLVALIAATIFLMFSFTKQLRKAQAAKDAGLFGDAPAKSQDADGGSATPVENGSGVSDE
jgi:hypothetical protein